MCGGGEHSVIFHLWTKTFPNSLNVWGMLTIFIGHSHCRILEQTPKSLRG